MASGTRQFSCNTMTQIYANGFSSDQDITIEDVQSACGGSVTYALFKSADNSPIGSIQPLAPGTAVQVAPGEYVAAYCSTARGAAAGGCAVTWTTS